MSIHGIKSSTFLGVKIVPPLFIAAICIGNSGLQDFLWFAIQALTARWFNWGERNALRYLFQGYFPWRAPEDWFEPLKWFGFKFKLLKGYRRAVIGSAIILFIQWLVIRSQS